MFLYFFLKYYKFPKYTFYRNFAEYLNNECITRFTVCTKCPECTIALVAIDKIQADVPVPDDHSYSSNSKPGTQSLIIVKSYAKLTTPSVIKVVNAGVNFSTAQHLPPRG